MLLRPAVLALGAVLLLPSCSSDEPGAEAASRPSAPSTLSATALEGALLTADDLPDGYDQVDVEEGEDDDSGLACLDRLSDLSDLEDTAAADAAVAFETATEAGVQHGLFAYAAPAEAEDYLAALRSYLTDCGSFSAAEDGARIEGRVTKLPLKGLGADGLAINLTFVVEGPGSPATTFALDAAATRAGGTISLVTVTSDTGRVDHKTTERLSGLALGRLTALA